MAERAGHASPGRLQHLLPRAKWDTDEVAVDLRSYVVKHLGDADAVLIIDETGDLKKGTAKVGVQRQYTGTAGRIENAQLAVYLAYAPGRAHVDRPAATSAQSLVRRPGAPWRRRCPDDIEFATKPDGT